MKRERRLNVTVVVLGDLGRSPRMQYHALALAAHDAEVHLVGYVETPLRAALAEGERVLVYPLPALALERLRGIALAHFVWSTIRFSFIGACLSWILALRVGRPDVVIVQNPPAVPTLLVAFLAASLHRARLVVDWHNFGYSMLALRFGESHPVVRAARWYERAVGRLAALHVCVSSAMRSELERWGIRGAVVLRDHPAAEFEAVTPVVRHDLFLRLSDALDLSPEEPAAGAGERTLFTERHSEGRAARVRLRADRPALVVSPTSWTDDEDFELLVAALGALASLIRRDEKREPDFPHLVLLITGEGRNRARFERRLEGWRDGRVRVRTAFLSAEDYTLALGSADLGLCLHRSSSRVDLPMKIADMYGAGVPVCAYDYGPCIREQVEEGVTGVLFRDAASLARVLHDLFRGFPAQAPRLEALRQNVMRRPRRSWEQNWEEVLWPLLDRRSPPGGPGG